MPDHERRHPEPAANFFHAERARFQQLRIHRVDPDGAGVHAAFQQHRLPGIDRAADLGQVLAELSALFRLEERRKLEVRRRHQAAIKRAIRCAACRLRRSEHVGTVADHRDAILSVQREAGHAPDAILRDDALLSVLLRVAPLPRAIATPRWHKPTRIEECKPNHAVSRHQLLGPAIASQQHRRDHRFPEH